jgi:Na+-translocating ferredoxin:NAD+ oxidoreductase subunit G
MYSREGPAMNMETTEKKETFGKFRQSNLVQAWLVLTLALFFGASLAGVQAKLGPLIEANKRNETLDRVPVLVWGSTVDRSDPSIVITPEVFSVKKEDKTSFYSLYKAARKGELAGWVVKTGGQGYADRIEMLIGLDPSASKITGLFILDQKETPGLGNKIVTPAWRGQFIGKTTDQPLIVSKTKTASGSHPKIDAVTGATISSTSVTRIINQAVKDLKGDLFKAAAAHLKGNG